MNDIARIELTWLEDRAKRIDGSRPVQGEARPVGFAAITVEAETAFDDGAIASLVEMWSSASQDEMVRLLQNSGVRDNLWKYVN